jgi:hypothetical protein
VMYPNQAIALTEVPVRSASTAGGVLQALQRMGGALGGALCGAVFYSVVTDRDNAAEAVGVHGYSLAYGAGPIVVVGFALSATGFGGHRPETTLPGAHYAYPGSNQKAVVTCIRRHIRKVLPLLTTHVMF